MIIRGWSHLNDAIRCDPATLTADQLPKDPGVYAWYHNGERKYVGKATALRDRLWGDHLGQSHTLSSSALRRNVAELLGFGTAAAIKRRDVTLTAEHLAAVRAWLMSCELAWLTSGSAAEASALERELLREYCPPLNKELPATATLTFNELLKAGGLAPETVRLLRHRDTKPRVHRALYDAAMTLDPRFAQYQERQGTVSVIEQFRNATCLAGFIAEPLTQATVFVGIWERLDERSERKDNPFEPDLPTSTAVEFNTRRLEEFDEYSGRLVIDWGDGMRAWVQRADKQDKRILEIRKTKRDPDFPGHLRFQLSLDQIEAMYLSWIQVLRNARGVYLLVRRKTGEQYVGSATGVDGFFGRWLCYQDGHGGNVAMRELAADPAEYDVNILEVAASDATTDDIYNRENMWKTKLGSRVTGLNR